MRTYIIWNSDKVANSAHHSSTADTTTYAGMREVEEEMDCSWSSYITTDNIENLIAGVYNETDVDLCYIEVVRV